MKLSDKYTIKLAEVPKPKIDSNCISDELIKVTQDSSKSYKEAVQQYADYFRREFGYGITQFSSKDNTLYRAWLFCKRDWHEEKALTIGACCFRERDFDDQKCWALQWIWIHPYFRGKGFLTKNWRIFVKECGFFFVEPPYSRTMEHFLLNNPERRQNHVERYQKNL